MSGTRSIQTIARVTLAIIWIYQGLVPKLLVADSGERVLTARIFGPAHAALLVAIAGVVEILIGLALLIFRRSRGIVWLSTIALVALTTTGIISTPRIAVTSFNAVTLTAAMLALAAIALR